MNLNALSGPLFKPDAEPRKTPSIYTRLHIATLDTAISSGAFTEERDRRLFHLMHAWRQHASEFNRRLDITELRTYINPIPEEIYGFRKALTGGVVLDETRKVLRQLTSLIVNNYAKESGIDKDTVLFETFKGAT